MQTSKSPKSKLKISLCIFLPIIIIFVICLLIIKFITNQNPQEPEPIPDFSTVLENTETINEAIDLYQQKIDSTESNEEKAELLYERAETLFDSAPDYEEIRNQIIEDLEKSYELNPNTDTAWRLYDFYQFYGDLEKASYYAGEL